MHEVIFLNDGDGLKGGGTRIVSGREGRRVPLSPDHLTLLFHWLGEPPNPAHAQATLLSLSF